MKIYTKTGDKGTTALFGGRRVSKSVVRMEVIGCIDELNSILGIALAEMNDPQDNKQLIQYLLHVQSDLFHLGADVATPYNVRTSLQKSIDRINLKQVKALETQIDELTRELPPITNFVLPGGHEVAAILQLARAVCRRAERNAVRLTRGTKLNPYVLEYLNRLSDWLFTVARFINHETKSKEIVWK